MLSKTHYKTVIKNSYFSNNRKIIARFELQYFLTEDDILIEEVNKRTFGVGIVMQAGGEGVSVMESKFVDDLFADRNKAENFLVRLASGEVRPRCLKDVVYEVI